MKWDEFRDLLVGIAPETPLGRMVAIRAENDKEVLKHFTKEQHRIRNEWARKKATKIPQKISADMMEQLKQAFISMAGGVNNC